MYLWEVHKQLSSNSNPKHHDKLPASFSISTSKQHISYDRLNSSSTWSNEETEGLTLIVRVVTGNPKPVDQTGYMKIVSIRGLRTIVVLSWLSMYPDDCGLVLHHFWENM
jgi:hypothetical protein